MCKICIGIIMHFLHSIPGSSGKQITGTLLQTGHDRVIIPVTCRARQGMGELFSGNITHILPARPVMKNWFAYVWKDG